MCCELDGKRCAKNIETEYCTQRVPEMKGDWSIGIYLEYCDELEEIGGGGKVWTAVWQKCPWLWSPLEKFNGSRKNEDKMQCSSR